MWHAAFARRRQDVAWRRFLRMHTRFPKRWAYMRPWVVIVKGDVEFWPASRAGRGHVCRKGDLIWRPRFRARTSSARCGFAADSHLSVLPWTRGRTPCRCEFGRPIKSAIDGLPCLAARWCFVHPTSASLSHLASDGDVDAFPPPAPAVKFACGVKIPSYRARLAAATLV